MLEADKLERFLEKGIIEVAPLAFMRGRTLNDSFVILDEAQNTTSEQMKMFLTRLGFNSKAVITGDVTQIDLPNERRSGLIEAIEVVGKIEGIAIVYFDERDVVRHSLVQRIIKAYDERAAASPAEPTAPSVAGNSVSRNPAGLSPVSMIINRQRRVRVPVRELEKFLARALRRLRLAPDSLSVCLVENSEIARWNRAYRGKKGPTDVLSFPADAPQGTPRQASCNETTRRGFSSASLHPLIIPPPISAISPSLRPLRGATRAVLAVPSTTKCASSSSTAFST